MFLSYDEGLNQTVPNDPQHTDIYALTLRFKLMSLFKILKILCDMEIPSLAQGRRWPLLEL